MKILKVVSALFVIVMLIANCASDKDWRTASRESADIAPDPLETKQAVIHVYGARAWSWRGWFAIHTWIATKKTNERVYTVYDVVGWRGHHGAQVMRAYQDLPDRYWYGEKPELLREIQGEEAIDHLIDQINIAAQQYPWKTTYKVFPGPNSNTFTAWIAQQVPELELKLPFTAIGKGYLD